MAAESRQRIVARAVMTGVVGYLAFRMVLLASSLLLASANDSVSISSSSSGISMDGSIWNVCPTPSVTWVSLPFQVAAFGVVAVALARRRLAAARVPIITSAALLALAGPAREAWWILRLTSDLDPAFSASHLLRTGLLVVLALAAAATGAVAGSVEAADRGGRLGGC